MRIVIEFANGDITIEPDNYEDIEARIAALIEILLKDHALDG